MLSKSEDGKRCVKKTDKCPRLCLTNTYNVVLKLAIQCTINCVVSSLIQQGLELRRLPCNQLASSFRLIKCGPLINNFSIHIGKTVYYKTAFLLHCKIHSKSVLIPGKFREKFLNFEKHASQNFLDPS